MLRIVVLLLFLIVPQVASAGELEDRFLLAVRTGDVAALKAALASGANVNAKFRYDRMALSFAADRGNPEVVKILLDAGADINARDTFYGMDAMSQAFLRTVAKPSGPCFCRLEACTWSFYIWPPFPRDSKL